MLYIFYMFIKGDNTSKYMPKYFIMIMQPPTCIQRKYYFLRKHAISSIFAFQEHQKGVFQDSRKINALVKVLDFQSRVPVFKTTE